MEFDLVEEILKAESYQLDDLLKAVLRRYAELFPDWEVSTISLQKNSDINEQLDRMIAMLQNLKTSP